VNFSSSLRRENSGRFVSLLAAVGVLMSLMVIFAQPAQAHHPILGVESVCNDETGKIEVTWSLANGDWGGRSMTVDQVTYTDGTGGFSNIVVGKTLGPNGSTTDVIVYPFSASDTKELTVRADWDGGSQDQERSASIDLSKVDRSECQPSTSTTPPPPPPPPPPPAPSIETTSVCVLETSQFEVSVKNVGTVDVLVGIVWDSGNSSDDLKPGETLSAVVPAGENWTIFEENVPVEQGTAESCDEVSPTSITATTTPEVSPETLPFTGAETNTSAALALLLVAGGALALVGARSFRAETDE